ncbi:MAG: alpha/beta fold hydrolase [Undibacterium sp.]|nr:alpha/beta fold hydrolase [Undibacterium sp.]
MNAKTGASINRKTQASPWLVNHSKASARMRLYCFSYAGGSASNYASWHADLDPAIEICAIELPGRGSRFGEMPQSSLTILTATLAKVIAAHVNLPFAFFGHSLGGLLSFEVARYLQQHYAISPLHLFVSGASAPQHRDTSKKLHLLEDASLIEELKDYNGTPPEVLAHRELMELLLPMIRADFALVGDYEYRVMPLLEIPITVLMGTEEAKVEDDKVNGWSKETSAECTIAWFEGDHFFIHPQRKAVLDCIRKELSPAVTAVVTAE